MKEQQVSAGGPRLSLASLEQRGGLVDGIFGENEMSRDVEHKAKARIQAWAEQLKKQAGRSVRVLDRFKKDQQEITELFGDDVVNSEPGKMRATASVQGGDGPNIVESRTRLACHRYDLVRERWRQMLHICTFSL
jgi:hypothetical protein